MSTDRTLARAARRTLLVAGIGMIAAPATPAIATTTTAPAAGTCQAQALNLSLLGAESATAINAGGTPCLTESRSIDLSVLGAVEATAVEATTNAEPGQRAAAVSRVADLQVGPQGFVDALSLNLLEGDAAISPQLDEAIAGLESRSSALESVLAPLSALGLRITSMDRTAITDQARQGLPLALPAVLPDLVAADVLSATATATCEAGRPVLRSGATIAGLRVLGTAIDANELADRALTVDTASLTLGQLVSSEEILRSVRVQAAPLSPLGLAIGGGERSLYDLLIAPGGLLGSVTALLPSGLTAATLVSQLDAVLRPVLTTSIPLPAGLLRAQITPRTSSIDPVTGTASASALTIAVSALGEPLVEGTVASVSVTSESAGCSAPPAVTPTPTPGPVKATTPPPVPQAELGLPELPVQPEYASVASQLQLQCDDAPLRLIDVRQSGTTMLVRGVAKREFVGRPLAIKQFKSGRLVGRTKVRGNGTFAMRLPLPPAEIRDTNRARYYAAAVGRRSNALKFTRRMTTEELQAKDGMVTFSGRTLQPLASGNTTVVIRRRVTCKKYVTVARVKADAMGRFSGSFKAPAATSYAIYRAQTRVPARDGGTKTFPTYTLPRLTGMR